MDKKQTIEFVHNLFKHVWSDLNQDKIAEYYHKDVKLQFGTQHAEFKDIIHRMQYIKSHYSKVENDIQDIVVDNDKFAARLHQTYHNKDVQKTYVIIFIYKIEGDKVADVWACVDPHIDYFEG